MRVLYGFYKICHAFSSIVRLRSFRVSGLVWMFGAPFWVECGVRGRVFGALGLRLAWTPKVCRIIAFYRFWAIVLPTFGGLGRV